MKKYKLEKTVWSESDFEIMGWHDCPIYGVRFEDNVAFDIDYILKWIHDEIESCYKFWISPVTLIFEQTHNLKIEIDLEFINGLEIYEIHQKKIETNEYKYHIETQEGDIELVASGYKQYIRKKPILNQNQSLSAKERGGYSFKIK